MTDVCEDCGQEPPQNVHEKTINHLRMVEDEFILGRSFECGTCGSRLNPVEPEDEESNRVKFLEGESLTHGME